MSRRSGSACSSHPTASPTWSPTRYGTLDVTAGGTITNDSLSYDIFSQAGQAIRSRPELLGGVRPLMLLAVGASQSAQRLTLYYNSIQPLHHVYDGYLLHILGGPFRTDIRPKLLRINTENEIVVLNQAAMRQPDSNTFRGVGDRGRVARRLLVHDVPHGAGCPRCAGAFQLHLRQAAPEPRRRRGTC